MHGNEISMHDNGNSASEFSWVKIPCMKLSTAQIPMKISEAKKSCQGRNFHFHAGENEILCMKFSRHNLFMHETLCTVLT